MPQKKPHDYSMEGLINVFGEHAKIYGAPNSEIDEMFNLAKALQEICIEIKRISSALESLGNEYRGYES